MNRKKFLTYLKENFKKGYDIINKKNHDYSKSEDPFRNFRLSEFVGVCSTEQAILSRMLDKIQRIANLLKAEGKVKEESIEDTLLDLMNYANILLVYLQDKKTKKK